MSTVETLLVALLAVEVLKLVYATETGRRAARKLGALLPNWRARRELRRLKEQVRLEQEQRP